MIPRRFYALSIFCAIALLFVFFFHQRTGLKLAIIPASFSEETGAEVQLDHDTGEGTTDTTNFIAASTPAADADGIATVTPVYTFKPPNWSNGDLPAVADGSPGIALSLTSSERRPKATVFPPPDTPLPERIRVSVIESSGTNEEIAASLIHSFGAQGRVELSLYMEQQRYGIDKIIHGFNLSRPLAANKSSSEFGEVLEAGTIPHVVVSSTCENDLIALDGQLTKLLDLRSTYLFCIIHQPERWKETALTDKIRPWIDQQLVDLVTQSQHTAHWLRSEVVGSWDFNATVTVKNIAPLFPIDLPDEQPLKIEAGGKSQYSMAIYGDHDTTRHRYADAWEDLARVRELARNVSYEDKTLNTIHEDREVTLHILGERMPPDIPKPVKPYVKIDSDISYLQQYEILSRSFIVIPTFNPLQPDYLSRLASWSIPAALIAGVPCTADEVMLQAYAYVPRDAVWFRYAGESEMKVAERVVGWSHEEHMHKRKVVKERAARIIQRNIELVDEWIALGVRRVERAGWRMQNPRSVEDFYAAIGSAAV